jgi:anti-sigma-K factor RskA
MTDQDRPDDLRDLLAAYALDAVDDEERARIDDLVAADPAARAEVARYEDAIAALAADDVAVAPPPGAWTAIQARISASPRAVGQPTADGPPPEAAAADEPPREGERDEPLAPVVPLTPPRPAPVPGAPPTPPAAGSSPPPTPGSPRRRADARSRRRLTMAAAAVVALLLGVLGVIRLADRPERRSSEVAAALADALTAPGTRLGRLSGSAGDAGVVLAADGRGFVTTSGLEPPTDDRVYQLWALDSGTPVSLGVVADDEPVAPFTAPAESRVLALSIEDRPGAEQPTLPPVATAEVT